MKKLLLTVCFLSFCALSYAQTEHLMFKGLPIDGSKQEFVKELQRQGYVYVDDDKLSGTFIGRIVMFLFMIHPLRIPYGKSGFCSNRHMTHGASLKEYMTTWWMFTRKNMVLLSLIRKSLSRHGERVMDMSYLPCGLIGVFIERCLCI